MRITLLPHVSSVLIKKLFGRKRSSKSSSDPTATPSTSTTSSSSPLPTIIVTTPSKSTMASPGFHGHSPQSAPPPLHSPSNASRHGHFSQGAYPPDHAPSHASGHAPSYRIHGEIGGNACATTAREGTCGGSAIHGAVYGTGSQRSPSVDCGGRISGNRPAQHMNDSMGTFDSNSEELFRETQRLPTALDSPTYGAYGHTDHILTENDSNHQLTAAKEEENVEAVKSEISFIKHQTVHSAESVLHVAIKTEETGRNTLTRLGTQEDTPQHVQKNITLAASHTQVAGGKTAELKTINGSMFAIHVKNTLHPTARLDTGDAKVLALRHVEREERAEIRENSQGSNEIGKAFNNTSGKVEPQVKKGLAEWPKYQFEADESDDEIEEMNPEEIGAVTARLKGLALAIQQKADRNIGGFDAIEREVFQPSDRMIINSHRIRRIH